MPFTLGCSVRHTTPANECAFSQGQGARADVPIAYLFLLEIGYSIDNASCFAIRFLLLREKAQAAPTARPKVLMRRRGADCLVVVRHRLCRPTANETLLSHCHVVGIELRRRGCFFVVLKRGNARGAKGVGHRL
jgi:hypothetical protein